MKAIVYTQYGSPDVLRLEEVEKPIPADNEVLIKIHATSVNYGDTLARNLGNIGPGGMNMPFLFWVLARTVFGASKPKNPILGNEFAGEIESVGKDVTRFKKGDQVFGSRGMSMRANAEFLCVPEDSLLTAKPANVSYEEASVIPGGALTALTLLRKVNIQKGQKVLILGASGSIGAAALQLAKHYGAEVTGVCGTPRIEMVKALGADKVIDYTKEDFTQGKETYDLIIDVLGRSSFSACRPVLNPGGRVLLVSFKEKQLLQMLWTSLRGGKKVICALSNETPEDLKLIKELVEAGAIKAVIDRSYPLEQTAEAHRYVEAGGKTGSVVITVSHARNGSSGGQS
jgi:NADPH:quinone reductase-like Zn-dependent oxidoreductase